MLIQRLCFFLNFLSLFKGQKLLEYRLANDSKIITR